MKIKKIVYFSAFIMLLIFIAFLLTAFHFITKGYGISKGKLYFQNAIVYLVDENGSATIISDQTKKNRLFEGKDNGDEVYVLHDGIQETYPSRTGAYAVVLIEKGDGSFKPRDEALGFVSFKEETTPVDFEEKEIQFKTQYVRTGVIYDSVSVPEITIITSKTELLSYYNNNKSIYALERRENPASDTTIGFLDACDSYTEDFFKENSLLIFTLEEGSGSIRHKVDSIKLNSKGKFQIQVRSVVPEIGTCDMAFWHLINEIPKENSPNNENDVEIFYNGNKLY